MWAVRDHLWLCVCGVCVCVLGGIAVLVRYYLLGHESRYSLGDLIMFLLRPWLWMRAFDPDYPTHHTRPTSPHTRRCVSIAAKPSYTHS